MAAAAVEELYGLPLAEFTPARDALAKALRAQGNREAAAAVKALRKPTVSAWALNQTARRHPGEVAALLEAGAALRGAQDAALAGDPAGLRHASRALADQLERVTDLTVAFLTDASAAHRDRIAATLRAAATSEDAGEQLRRGVVVADLDPSGFGLGDGPAAAPSPTGRSPDEPAAEAVPPRHPPEPTPEPDREALDSARRELRRANAEAQAAEATARRRAERAEILAVRAAQVHQEAESARSEAEAAAAEAEAARRRARDAVLRLERLAQRA